jgi:hypothetical protein
MSKKQLIHFGLGAIVALLISFISIGFIPVLKSNQTWIWASLVFLFALFLVVNYVLFSGIRSKSQQEFMLLFALSFGLKVFGTLAWLIIILFIIGFKDFEFVGWFFTMYFIFTFLLMAEVWKQTKRK